MKTRILALLAVSAALMLSACETQTQTTSGQDYLAAYPKTAAATPSSDMDAEVRRVAAVEPTLRFPARIGIARLGPSGLTAVPSDEAEHWSEVAGRLGAGYGAFIPISPMIAAMVELPQRDGSRTSYARHAIDTIRLAAARQHLDAVLIYEVDGTADAHDTPMSIADWTLIGAFVLPTQKVKAVGVAQAMLIDVRNGYPYGTIQSTAADDHMTTAIGWRDSGAKLKARVEADAVAKLAGEAEGMMRELRAGLAEYQLRHAAR
jgi:hypothetical protein